MSCLVFSVPGSEAQLRRAHYPSAVSAPSSKPCWAWLLVIHVEHLLHNVLFHFVLLTCSCPEGAAGRQAGWPWSWPQAKPLSTAGLAAEAGWKLGERNREVCAISLSCSSTLCLKVFVTGHGEGWCVELIIPWFRPAVSVSVQSI